MNVKRIICAVTNDLTYDRRMQRICSTLASAGAIVTLVGRRRPQSTPFEPHVYQSVRLRGWFEKGFLFYAEYNLRLFFFLLRQPSDVLCACDLDTAMAVRYAGWWKNKKTVYDAHEYFTEVPELTDRPWVKSVWEWIAKRTIPGFDLRYTVGESLAEIMTAKYHVPFHVIRNIAPVSPQEVPHIPLDLRPSVILYQGALNVGRGLEACILAMKALPDWHLWLAGEGDITAQLKSLAHASGVGERVRFLGWVNPEDLPALLGKVRLAVNLRERGSLNDYYSLPNKFFDALHAGLPSIHMAYPEYEKIYSRFPCAILIAEPSAGEVVSAVQTLEHDPALWHQMSEACYAASREFHWGKESERLLELYTTV